MGQIRMEDTPPVPTTSVLCVEAAKEVRAYLLCKADFNCSLTQQQYVHYINTFDFGLEYCSNEREAGKIFKKAAGDQETYIR